MILFSRISCKPVSFDWLATKTEVLRNEPTNTYSAWSSESFNLSPVELGMYAFPYTYEEMDLIPIHHFQRYTEGLKYYHIFYLYGNNVKIYHHLTEDPKMNWKCDSLWDYEVLFKKFLDRKYKKIIEDPVIIFKNSSLEVVLECKDQNINILQSLDDGSNLVPRNIKIVKRNYVSSLQR